MDKKQWHKLFRENKLNESYTVYGHETEDMDVVTDGKNYVMVPGDFLRKRGKAKVEKMDANSVKEFNKELKNGDWSKVNHPDSIELAKEHI